MTRQFPGTDAEWMGALIVFAFVAAAVLAGLVIDRLRRRPRQRPPLRWRRRR